MFLNTNGRVFEYIKANKAMALFAINGHELYFNVNDYYFDTYKLKCHLFI